MNKGGKPAGKVQNTKIFAVYLCNNSKPMKNFLSALLATLAGIGLSAQTFTEVIPITCGDTAYVSGLGYPTWNPPVILDRANYGHSSLLGDFVEPNVLQYLAPPWFVGRDTVVVQCAQATQITCQTGVYVFDVACPATLAPVFVREVDCLDTALLTVLNGWWAPRLLQDAQHGHAQVILHPNDAASVWYRPDPGFEGLDWALVDLFHGRDTVLFLFQMYCNLASTIAAPFVLKPVHYPNPVSQQLFIQASPSAQWPVQVFDSLGKACSVPVHAVDSGVALDVRLLMPGVYRAAGLDAQGRRFLVSFVKMP